MAIRSSWMVIRKHVGLMTAAFTFSFFNVCVVMASSPPKPFCLHDSHQTVVDDVLRYLRLKKPFTNLTRFNYGGVDPRSPFASIQVDKQLLSEETFKYYDLKRTLVRLESASLTPQSNWNLDAALILLTKHAENFPMIAGIEVDAKKPLS